MFEITAYDVIEALAIHFNVGHDVVETALGEVIDEFQDHKRECPVKDVG